MHAARDDRDGEALLEMSGWDGEVMTSDPDYKTPQVKELEIVLIVWDVLYMRGQVPASPLTPTPMFYCMHSCMRHCMHLSSSFGVYSIIGGKAPAQQASHACPCRHLKHDQTSVWSCFHA
jgi:hypothetical protein